jgi:tRNA dimethylallyltransferase
VVREQILAMARHEGWGAVHSRLAAVDPVAAARINPNDPQRLQRALEVYLQSGIPLTELQQTSHEPCPFRICQIAIVPDNRAALHQRIQSRFATMLKHGLIDEVRHLYHRGDLRPDLPAMRAVGYRQVWQHIEGSLPYDDLLEKGTIATRQLAKRQLTWLRQWPDLHRLVVPDMDVVLKIARADSILV